MYAAKTALQSLFANVRFLYVDIPKWGPKCCTFYARNANIFCTIIIKVMHRIRCIFPNIQNVMYKCENK